MYLNLKRHIIVILLPLTGCRIAETSNHSLTMESTNDLQKEKEFIFEGINDSFYSIKAALVRRPCTTKYIQDSFVKEDGTLVVVLEARLLENGEFCEPKEKIFIIDLSATTNGKAILQAPEDLKTSRIE